MMKNSQLNSYLFGGNAPYVEEQYEAYLDNPASVPETWRTYFDALQNVPASDGTNHNDVAHGPIVESFAQRAKSNGFVPRESSGDLATARKQGQGMLEVIDKGSCDDAHPVPLLFVHGGWHSASCWANFVDFFADAGYRAVALSLRGHGGSPTAKQAS